MKVIFGMALLCMAICYSYGDVQFECPFPDKENATLFPHPDDCTTYYECQNGEPIPMKCPDGLHFNAKLNVCDWPSQAGCQTLNN